MQPNILYIIHVKNNNISLLIFSYVNLWYFVFFVDSTVLAYILKLLNERHDYGIELILLSVDEGITGYRDDSLEVNHFETVIMT